MTAENVIPLVFESESDKLAFAEAKLGINVEHFLKSEVGRLLRGRAQQEIDEVKQELLTCSPYTPWGRRKIQRLQNRAQVAEFFTQWCVDAITDGRNAEAQLIERDN